MKPYPIDGPFFCKDCRKMRLVEYDAEVNESNMHCCSGVKWIIDSFVDGRGHWDVREGARRNLPFCKTRNADGKCKLYIPKE